MHNSNIAFFISSGLWIGWHWLG